MKHQEFYLSPKFWLIIEVLISGIFSPVAKSAEENLDLVLTPESQLACWIGSEYSTQVTCVKYFPSWEFSFQSRPPQQDWPTLHLNIGGFVRAAPRIRRIFFEPNFSPHFVTFIQKFLVKQPPLRLDALIFSLAKLDDSENSTGFGNFVQGASLKALNLILSSSRNSLYYFEQIGDGRLKGLSPFLSIPVMENLAILKLTMDVCTLNSLIENSASDSDSNSDSNLASSLFPPNFVFDETFPHLKVLKVKHQQCKITPVKFSDGKSSDRRPLNLAEMWTTLYRTKVGPATSVKMVDLDLDLDLTTSDDDLSKERWNLENTFPNCTHFKYGINRLFCGL